MTRLPDAYDTIQGGICSKGNQRKVDRNGKKGEFVVSTQGKKKKIIVSPLSNLGKNGEFGVSTLGLGGERNCNGGEVLRLVDGKESESGMNASEGKVCTNLPFGLLCGKRSRKPKRNSTNEET